MAEVLIKLEHCGVDKDPLTAWTRLHPVCVKPDGWKWGTAERLPKFCVIRITDMTVAAVEPYLEPHLEPRPGSRIMERKWWERAQLIGEYDPFVSMPTAGAISDKTEVITVPDYRYQEMVETMNYDPFWYPPAVTREFDVIDEKTLVIKRYKELTGIVSYIELTGIVQTMLAIRRWKFDIDDVAIPIVIKDQIKNTGFVSVTKAQIINFIKRTISG